MDRLIIELIEKYEDEISNRWLGRIKEQKDMFRMHTQSEELYTRTNEEFLDLIYSHIYEKYNDSSNKFLDFADRVMKTGWHLSYLTQGLQTFRRTLLDVLFEKVTENKEAINTYQQIDRWMDPLMNRLIDASAANWEHTLTLQKVALQELSAPLIPVFTHISVMPLVGTIDTERAKLIMENLLQGVIQHRAKVVLIDITGVPVVDTMVAHHIIQAAEAVRLIGATCILVGIRPEIAQTIVNLGIDLGQFPTQSTLFSGIQTALKLTNRKIVEM